MRFRTEDHGNSIRREDRENGLRLKRDHKLDYILKDRRWEENILMFKPVNADIIWKNTANIRRIWCRTVKGFKTNTIYGFKCSNCHVFVTPSAAVHINTVSVCYNICRCTHQQSLFITTSAAVHTNTVSVHYICRCTHQHSLCLLHLPLYTSTQSLFITTSAAVHINTVSVNVKINILCRVCQLHFKMSSENTVPIYQLGDQSIDGLIIKKH
jgi:hypothetical protein